MSVTTAPRRRFLPATLAIALSSVLMITACTKQTQDSAVADDPQNNVALTTDTMSGAQQASLDRLLISYANMAQATYNDSLETALALQVAVNTYVDLPTEANLDAAKAAYKAARQPYSQTEVFRFDEGFVSADDKRDIGSIDSWEGQVNAWPLDEALIDYVSDSYEGEYNSSDNIINSQSITVGSVQQDTSSITPDLLIDMSEIGGSEANVTTGYHAIEFLLWGQDINGIGEGAGTRPISDYMTTEGQCTSGDIVNDDVSICERRGQYLKAITQLLVDDLAAMTVQWQPKSNHTLRSDMLARRDDNALRQVIYQMGSLASGELASQRMQAALVTGSTEYELDCFSDLTHVSYANNARGIHNLFNGNYRTINNKTIGGYGLKQYLIDTDHKDAADQLTTDFTRVKGSFDLIVEKAEKEGIKVDQMIATVGQAQDQGISAQEQNMRRGWIENGITSLQTLTGSLENAAKAVGIDNLAADNLAADSGS